MAWLVLGGGGCFTDPVNRPPVVGPITPVVPTILRGEEARFTVTVSDPDSDQTPIAPTWTYAHGSCPDTSPGNWPTDARPVPPGQELVVPPEDTREDFCVWVFARDRYGAIDVKTLHVNPINRAPTAKIDVQQPICVATQVGHDCAYPLYSDFQLVDTGSSDPDDMNLNPSWSLDSVPLGSQAVGNDNCVPDDPHTFCFSADLPGTYTVSLVVEDASRAKGTTQVSLLVAEDQPPCIAASRPNYLNTHLVRDPTAPNTFEVDQVIDDGDPYPRSSHGSQAVFDWFVDNGDGKLVFQGDHDFFSFDVPRDPTLLGKTGRVRVEIHDRNTTAIDGILAGCGEAADLCESPPRSGCFQRVTWSIEYRL